MYPLSQSFKILLIVRFLIFNKLFNKLYSTSITKNTLDEAPLAYKPAQEIIDRISKTVEVVSILKPIYNFKDTGQ